MARLAFDTNVYISYLLGGQGAKKLFHLWRLKKFDLYISKFQIEEIIGVIEHYFQNKDSRQQISPEKQGDLLLLLQNRAVIVANRRYGQRSPDTDDDWIIGIAIEARAEVLVTQNTKDIYPSLIRPSESIQIMTIAEVLVYLES